MTFSGQAPRLAERSAGPRRIEQLVYRMRGLRMIGNILHVATHPDDEDAGLMAYMSHKYGARIAYWSATRGEGGQNRLGPYSGDALGIYRTWESLAARAIDGGESLYGPFFDFGFSKNGAEATAKWGRQELVREIVRVIRLMQPQVLIARFSGEPCDGHGQHQAIGSATIEAFDAAANPTLFPELELPAWRAVKLYQSTGGDWQPGEENSLGKLQPEFERDGYLRIDTGELDPVAGLTYQQQAWIAFNCHQSQAMGFLPQRGSFYYYYRLKTSRVATQAREQSFYDGLDPTLLGLLDCSGEDFPGLREILESVREDIDKGLQLLHPDDPAAAASPLLQGLGQLRHLQAQLDTRMGASHGLRALGRLIDRKIVDFEDVAIGCMGLDAECIANNAHAVAGENIRIRGKLWNPRGIDIKDCRFRMTLPEGWTASEVPSSPPAASRQPLEEQADFEIAIAPDAPTTTPYWLKEPHDGYRYTISGNKFDCEPFGLSEIVLTCELVVGEHHLSLQRPALRREPFAGGFRELPLSVLPAVSVKPQISRVFLPVRSVPHEMELQVAVHKHVSQAGHSKFLRVAVPEGWTVTPSFVELPTDAPGDMTAARFRLTIPANVRGGRYQLEYQLGLSAHPAMTLDPVWMGAPGLPRSPDATTCAREAFLARPARVEFHMIDAKFAQGLTYGYVRGAADGLLDSLANFGLDTYAIGDEEMGYLNLFAFDGIIIGPNAYLMRDELRRNAGRFLDYVSNGGTLIVQYQAYGYELQSFTPYPIDYSHPHDRVTFPDAPVTILDAQHPLMTRPNKITEEDFDGWVRDRGLYFLGSFDSRYVPLLGCNDPGEELKRGGLVATSYGRGAFVYVGYSLFRQIPAAVPGAFRLLANLLALPEALLLERMERLRKLSLFSFMTDEQLMLVARIVSERYENAGAYLCRQGDSGRELFIIMKGEVEIVTHTAGRRLVLPKAGAGQVVGEFAVLADIPRTADLRALTDLHLLVISGATFRELVRRHSEIAENIIRVLVGKVLDGSGQEPGAQRPSGLAESANPV